MTSARVKPEPAHCHTAALDYGGHNDAFLLPQPCSADRQAACSVVKVLADKHSIPACGRARYDG